MKTAIVKFENGTQLTTSINGTDAEIREYYRVGIYFNLGYGEHDNMQRVLTCEVLPHPKRTLKRFPNGFRCWMETYHEVVSFITTKCNPDATGVLKEIQEAQGIPGFYDLAEKWTDEFEKLNKGREWDGEFYEEVDEFCEQQLKA